MECHFRHEQPVRTDRWIQFQIYSDPSGGLVNVMLGSKNPLPNDRPDQPDKSFFDQPLYLQITVDANRDNQISAADSPLLPRQTILPVIFAGESANARKLQGYDWSALFGTNNPVEGKVSGSRIASNSISAAQIADLAVTSSKIATGAVNRVTIAPGAVPLDKLASDTTLKFAQVVGTNLFQMSSSDGWATPPEMTLSMTGSNFLVVASASGRGEVGGGAASVAVRLQVDNGPIVPLGSFLTNHDGYRGGFSYQYIVSGLGSGLHTFRLQLRAIADSYCDPASFPETESRRLQIFELR